MNTLAKISELLYALHQEFPTDGQRHNITFNQETNSVEVSVFANGKWYGFVPGEKDLSHIQAGVKFMRKYVDENSKK